MGFRIDIAAGAYSGPIMVPDYSVQESATPLSAGDSSGAVGTFTITVPMPDPDIPIGPLSPWRAIREFGYSYLDGRDVRIEDPRKGFTLGTIRTSTLSKDGGTITYSGDSRLSQLNVYGIQAQPFVGILRDAFEYYLSLAGITSDLFVADEIANRPVVFPGWHGELWFHLKQMAAAQDCDISLVSGMILLRAIRERIASQGRDTARNLSSGGRTLAQAVEVYQYNNTPITNALVYPPGGWNPEVEVLNVNAGETEEYTLELSSSLTSIQPPTMVEFIPQDHDSSSAYTVVADDGLPVPPGLWEQFGGSAAFEISPETNTIKVTLSGAIGLPTASGEEARNFSLALGSDTTGNRYSTLRIVGSGVAFDKQLVRIRTGISSAQTATEVGVTIDNPFLSTTDDVYRAGTRAAREYSGSGMSLQGSVISINRRGDSGQVTSPTYAMVQAELGVRTYAQVQSYYLGLGLVSYKDVRQHWFDYFQDDDVDQVFGNVQGARIFDRDTRRWYRIRQANPTPGGIAISGADDDLTLGDVDDFYSGLTYGQVQAFLGQFTYREVLQVGMWKP